MRILTRIKHHGIIGSLKVLSRICRNAYFRWRCRSAPIYNNPTPIELVMIEQSLRDLGIAIHDYMPSTEAFKKFKEENWFPPAYHGGQHSGVWDEKLLEYWLSSNLLGLKDYSKEDIFVDIAACDSPWAKTLRERLGITTFAIDLDSNNPAYRDLAYYRIEDATKTTFQPGSVTGCSLHCAYEMFMGDDDRNLIIESARILKPGGKMIILPLYMHTHYCTYTTPEYFGKGHSDISAKEYIRLDCMGIPSSRKYDAKTLKNRVLDPIINAGMKYRLHVLRNKLAFGENIYCHFILELKNEK